MAEMNESKSSSGLGIALIALGGLFLLAQFIPGIGDLMWGLAFFGGGFAFYMAYRANPANWGLLIPGYVLAAIGGIFVVELIPTGRLDLTGAYVMFAIAAPFLYVFWNNRANWWALIPGGIMATIGLAILLEGFLSVIPAIMIVGGIYLLGREYFNRKGESPRVEEQAFRPIREDKAEEKVSVELVDK